MSNSSQEKFRTDISDRELIKEIANRQVWALEELYDRHAERLYGLAVKILHDPKLAEDVLQHIFYCIWEETERFDRVERKLIVWLMLFCRDFCIKKLRALEDSSIVMREMLKVTQDRDVTSEKMDKAHFAESLAEAFAQLPSEQRLAIELAFFKGYKQSEISSHLNLPLSIIQEQIRQGMQRLRTDMFVQDQHKNLQTRPAKVRNKSTNP